MVHSKANQKNFHTQQTTLALERKFDDLRQSYEDTGKKSAFASLNELSTALPSI
jgi:hypothetical protein